MDAIFFGVVCAQLVATTIALSVFSYGILQYIRVRHHKAVCAENYEMYKVVMTC